MLAVVRSVYLELSAKLQMQAMLIAGPGGNIVYLDEREVAATSGRQARRKSLRAWRIFARAGSGGRRRIAARCRDLAQQSCERRSGPRPLTTP